MISNSDKRWEPWVYPNGKPRLDKQGQPIAIDTANLMVERQGLLAGRKTVTTPHGHILRAKGKTYDERLGTDYMQHSQNPKRRVVTVREAPTYMLVFKTDQDNLQLTDVLFGEGPKKFTDLPADRDLSLLSNGVDQFKQLVSMTILHEVS